MAPGTMELSHLVCQCGDLLFIVLGGSETIKAYKCIARDDKSAMIGSVTSDLVFIVLGGSETIKAYKCIARDDKPAMLGSVTSKAKVN
jgi:hypothetical protein